MRIPAVLFVLPLLAACASHAHLTPSNGAAADEQPSERVLSQFAEPTRSTTRKSATSAQGLVGVSLYNDDLEFTSTGPSGETATADLSNMPTLGFGGHYRLWGDPGGFEGGLDGTLLFSWWRDSAEVLAVGGGTVVVSSTVRMFITDIGFGLYASKKFNNKWRLYGGVGPLVQFGNAKFEDNLTSSSDSGFGVGGYLRGGVEFRFDRSSWLGVGVRGTVSEIDYGARDVSTDAVQVFVTITQDF